MWVLIFYMSYGFGTGSTGGPSSIPGFVSYDECRTAAAVLERELPKGKLDLTQCVKVK